MLTDETRHAVHQDYAKGIDTAALRANFLGMAPEVRVLHLMGEPTETRHLFVANEDATISFPWSIHAGAGIGAYAFIWAMAGDNASFTDMDMLSAGALL